MPLRRQALWIDCDTGVDDALALLFAARTPAAEIVGVSTVAGNCPLPMATENTLRVLELAGAGRTPVHPGAAAPLAAALRPAGDIHGDDGLGGCAGRLSPARTRTRPEPAAAALARALRARPGQITVVATGPLTNLAVMLALDPEAATLARQVVVMGGAVTAAGNVTPVAEFNIATDPEAARAVLTGPWRVTLVGLDVTMRVRVGAAEAVALRNGGGATGRFAADLIEAYGGNYGRVTGRAEAPMHDPLAVAVALDPSLVRAVQLPVDVETRGELTRGMVVADQRALAQVDALKGRRLVQVCVEVDERAAVARLTAAWSNGG